MGCMPILVLFRDGQCFFGSRDTLARRGGILIPVVSQDGQSISGYWRTLTGELCGVYAHPGIVPGWSVFLWIPGYSDCLPCPRIVRVTAVVNVAMTTICLYCVHPKNGMEYEWRQIRALINN